MSDKKSKVKCQFKYSSLHGGKRKKERMLPRNNNMNSKVSFTNNSMFSNISCDKTKIKEEKTTQLGLSPAEMVSDKTAINKMGKVNQDIRSISKYAEFLQNTQQKGKKYPTHIELIQQHKFGRPSLNHQFTSEKTLDQVLVILFKRKNLAAEDFQNVMEVHPYYLILGNMVMWAKDVDFSSLKQEEGRHLTQETISFSRTKLLTACAIHYDLHMPLVIRYLSGEYMAEFRNAFEIDKLLESRGCPSEIRQD